MGDETVVSVASRREDYPAWGDNRCKGSSAGHLKKRRGCTMALAANRMAPAVNREHFTTASRRMP